MGRKIPLIYNILATHSNCLNTTDGIFFPFIHLCCHSPGEDGKTDLQDPPPENEEKKKKKKKKPKHPDDISFQQAFEHFASVNEMQNQNNGAAPLSGLQVSSFSDPHEFLHPLILAHRL